LAEWIPNGFTPKRTAPWRWLFSHVDSVMNRCISSSGWCCHQVDEKNTSGLFKNKYPWVYFMENKLTIENIENIF
jgi:hypothetical protein